MSEENGKRKLKIKFHFPTSQENGKRKWRIKFRFPVSQENGKRKSKLFPISQSRKKMKNENRSFNSIFQCCRKTENKNGTRIH